MEESRQRKIGSGLSYVALLVNVLVQLLYTPFLISKIGQSEYGLFSLISSIIGYLTILDLGFGNAIIVYTAKYRVQKKYEEEQKLHGMFNIVFKIIGLLIAIIGLILFLNIDNFFGKTMTSIELEEAKIMMLILIFNLIITFWFNIYSSIISAYEKFTFQKILVIISTLLKPLIMIPLLIIGFKAIAMTLVITFINLLVLLSNYIFCKTKLNIKIKYNGFDRKTFKTILSYSVWIFLAVIVDKINWSIDQFILGSVSSTIAISVYSAAGTINQLFINLSTAISGVLLPKVSKMIGKNASNDEITNEFIKVGRIQYLIIFLVSSGLVLFGKEFFILWLGEKFIDSYYIAMILVLPLSIPLIQNLGISIRQAMNKHKFPAIVNILIAALNIAITIPLAIKYGAIGAAFGTGIGIGLSCIIINIYYHIVLKINIIKFWKEIIKMTVSFIIPLSIIIILMSLYRFNNLLTIIIYGSIYTILYLIVIYNITMNQYEKNMFKSIVKKVKVWR